MTCCHRDSTKAPYAEVQTQSGIGAGDGEQIDVKPAAHAEARTKNGVDAEDGNMPDQNSAQAKGGAGAGEMTLYLLADRRPCAESAKRVCSKMLHVGRTPRRTTRI